MTLLGLALLVLGVSPQLTSAGIACLVIGPACIAAAFLTGWGRK